MGQRDAAEGLANAAIKPLVDAHLVRAEQRRGRHLVRAGPRPADRAGAGGQRRLVRGAPEHVAASGGAVGGAEAARWAAVERRGAGRGGGVGSSATKPSWSRHERDFLAACRKARERAERERRQGQRIRMLAAAAVAGMLIASALAFLALSSRSIAEVQRNSLSSINWLRRRRQRRSAIRSGRYCGDRGLERSAGCR